MKAFINFLSITIYLFFASSCNQKPKNKSGYAIKSKIYISIGKENATIYSAANKSTFLIGVNVLPSNNIIQNHDYGNDFLLEFSQKTNKLIKSSPYKSRTDYPLYVSVNGFNYAIHTDANLMEGRVDSYLRKFDKNWKMIWSKRINKGIFPDNAIHLLLTPQKQLLVVLDDHDVKKNKQETYLAILKYNLDGELISDKNHFNQEIISPRVLIKTLDKNYLILSDYGHDFEINMMLLKMNTKGDTLWSKKYPNFSIEKSLELADSSILLFGHHFYSEKNNSEYIQNLRIMRINGDGVILWEKYIKDYNYEEAMDIKAMNNGNYMFLSQYTQIMNKGTYPWLMEFDENGKLVWSKKMSEYNSSYYEGSKLLKVNDGFFLINGKTTKNGSFNRVIMLTKFEAN